MLKLIHDTKLNQFFIDPFFTGLVSYVYSKIAYPQNDQNGLGLFPYLMGLSRLASSITYNLIKDENENKISKLFRDYLLPPIISSTVAYVYGLTLPNEQNLVLPAFLITIFSELMTDVLEYKLEKRINK